MELGNIYNFCYPEDEKPPLLPGDNKVLDYQATLAIMDNEKRPEILRLFKLVKFDPEPRGGGFSDYKKLCW